MLKRLLPTVALTVAAFALTSVAASAASVNIFRQSHPWNICHQGGEDVAPGNTMYALKRCMKVGGNMLELDIGVTKDNKVIMQHNATVDSRTSGTGEVASYTLAQIQKLDNAHWFSTGVDHYSHDKAASAYPFRGIATGKKKPPAGYKASDFRVASLAEVLKAFPKTPINLEIKGRTTKEASEEYLTNARVLAAELKNVKRKDIIVVSFKQPAVDEFHKLAPRIPVAPGTAGMEAFLLHGESPGDGVVALQPPITFDYPPFGRIEISNAAWITQAHAAGYAWQNWFDGPDPDTAVSWAKMVERCGDGIMSSSPKLLAAFLKKTKSPAACSKRP